VEQYLNTIVVGSEGFQEAVRKQIGITMYDLIIPRSYRALARPSLGQLFAGIDDLDDRDRTIRRAQVVYGYRQSEIARTLNLHPNTTLAIQLVRGTSNCKSCWVLAAIANWPVPNHP